MSKKKIYIRDWFESNEEWKIYSNSSLIVALKGVLKSLAACLMFTTTTKPKNKLVCECHVIQKPSWLNQSHVLLRCPAKPTILEFISFNFCVSLCHFSLINEPLYFVGLVWNIIPALLIHPIRVSVDVITCVILVAWLEKEEAMWSPICQEWKDWEILVQWKYVKCIYFNFPTLQISTLRTGCSYT